MFDDISFSIPRLQTLAVTVKHFRKSTVTLHIIFALTPVPAFQPSGQVFPTSASPTHMHTNLCLMLITLHSTERNIIAIHILKSIKGSMQEEAEIMQLRQSMNNKADAV